MVRVSVNRQSETSSRVREVPLREDMIDIIAGAIDARPDLAPFQLPGASVYQFTVTGEAERPAAMVTIWPSLRRVDAIGSGAAVVFTRIKSVQLVEGVEILFRRESGEYLIVAKGGRIIVRS
jgi:hypothetical protein